MAKIIEIQLRADEASSETVYVEPLGGSLYRLDDTPILANSDKAPIHFGDVVALEQLADGSYRVLHVVERAALRHHSWAVSRSFAESAECDFFAADVAAAGGRCERSFGGFLTAHVPEDSSFDAEAELRRRIDRAKSRANEV